MSSCECCYTEAINRTWFDGSDRLEMYYRVMAEHQQNECVCTQVGTEGDKARAGQFWDGTKDKRKEV